MSTVNGIGTMRYDWRWEDDRTASATLWFVIFFFPIAPLRREHVRVVGHGIRPSGWLDTIAAFLGSGSGFHTTMEILGVQPMSWPGVVRTYVMGWVVTPLAAFGVPLLLMAAVVLSLLKFGIDFNDLPPWAVAPLGLAMILWMGVIVARILDRAAGRRHIDPAVVVADQTTVKSPRRRPAKKSS